MTDVIGVGVVCALVLLVVLATMSVVIRDDPGRRPAREDYDSRRPEP